MIDHPDLLLGTLIDKSAKTDIRAIWTSTAEGFFKRVNGAYLGDLHRSLLGLAPDHPTVTTFAKLKKREEADRLDTRLPDEIG